MNVFVTMLHSLSKFINKTLTRSLNVKSIPIYLVTTYASLCIIIIPFQIVQHCHLVLSCSFFCFFDFFLKLYPTLYYYPVYILIKYKLECNQTVVFDYVTFLIFSKAKKVLHTPMQVDTYIGRSNDTIRYNSMIQSNKHIIDIIRYIYISINKCEL